IRTLKQSGLAAINASNQYRGLMPPAFGNYGGQPINNGNASIWYHLLPFLDETAIYAFPPPVFDAAGKILAKPTYAQTNGQQFKVPVYRCPSETSSPTGQAAFTDNATYGVCSYAANWQVFANGLGAQPAIPGLASSAGVRIPDALKRGASKTMLFTEKQAVCATPANGGSLWAMRGPYSADP